MNKNISKGSLLAILVFSVLAIAPLTANAVALSVSVTASPLVANIGDSVTYTASATGGSGAYTYFWSGDCSGSAVTCTRTYTSAGTKTASVLVSSGPVGVTGTKSVTVNGGGSSALSVSVSASPNPADINQTVTYTASATGGNGSYTYLWSGDCSGSASTCSRAYSSAGTKTASVTVGSGAMSQTATKSVTVNGSIITNDPLSVTVTAAPNPADINQTVTYTASANGGNGSYTYLWSGDCAGTASTCSRAYPTAGNYTASVLVTSAGQGVTGTRSIIVNGGGTNNALSVTVTASPNPADINQTVTYVASANGGNGSYTYLWSGDCSGSSSTCSRAYSTAGNKTASVLLTSGGQGVTGTASVVVNGGNTCTSNYEQRCVGTSSYWYDSCGNQGSYIQSCGNNNNNYSYVQTNYATGVYNNQATFNGYLYENNSYSCNNYVWFQYGTTTSYGSETSRQLQNYSGSFSQLVSNLYNGNVYHFRAAAQDCSGNIIYGQDRTTYNNNNNYGNLAVTKTVRNLTKGTGFASSTYAGPSDTLMFMITLQSVGNQTVNNVFIKDLLPAKLIYGNQLVVACSGINTYSNNCTNNYNYSGNITSGINLNTIYENQTVTITYQAQVAGAESFPFGSTTLVNSVSVTSSQTGYTPTSNASVIVTKGGQVLGASTENYPSTGLTNNIWVDSFILPLLLALIGLGMWKTGMFVTIERWLDGKRKISRTYKAEKELTARIAEIQKFGNR